MSEDIGKDGRKYKTLDALISAWEYYKKLKWESVWRNGRGELEANIVWQFRPVNLSDEIPTKGQLNKPDHCVGVGSDSGKERTFLRGLAKTVSVGTSSLWRKVFM